MKRFLIYFFKIIACVLCMLCVLDFTYTLVIKNSVPRNKFRYALSLKNRHYDALFLGSSRVENSIVTSEFKKQGFSILNMGISGAKLGDTYFLLKLLNENKVTFDKVFVQVDYLYNEDGIVFTEARKAYLIPLIRDENVKQIFKKYDDDFLCNYYIPFYRYAKNSYRVGFREFFNSLLNKGPRYSLEDGYVPRYNVAKHKKFILPKHKIKKSKVLEEINNLCESINLTPVYFTAPFCNNLINEQFLVELKNDLNNFFDYSKVIENDENFDDCQHLNDKGAREFTNQLIRDFFE